MGIIIAILLGIGLLFFFAFALTALLVIGAISAAIIGWRAKKNGRSFTEQIYAQAGFMRTPQSQRPDSVHTHTPPAGDTLEGQYEVVDDKTNKPL